MIPQQHAIERPGCCDELGSAARKHDAVDQGVDCPFLMPMRLREPGVGSRRAPKSALLVAGRKAFRPSGDNNVKIPLAQPVFILDRIDKAHAHAYPQALQ